MAGVAAHLLTTNPVLALQLQVQAQQPVPFEQAVSGLADGSAGPIIGELIKKIDPAKLQPTAVLHVHIYDQALDGPFGPADPEARIARVEGIGPVFLETVRQWLGQACTVKLQPVIDTGTIPAVDRYEFPVALREAILTRSPASVFPWSNSLNRRNDLDHTNPYLPPDRGGPPGQTGTGSSGPLTRREHRYKTLGPIAVRQPEPGTHVWRTRYGRVLIVNPSGTYDLGTGDFAHTVWTAIRHCGAQSPLETKIRQLLAVA